MKEFEEEINRFIEQVESNAIEAIKKQGSIPSKVLILAQDKNDKDTLMVVDGTIPFPIFKPDSPDFFKEALIGKMVFQKVQESVMERGKILCFTYTELGKKGDQELLTFFCRKDALGEDEGNIKIFKVNHEKSYVDAMGDLINGEIKLEEVLE